MNKENGWDASASWNGYMYQGKVALLLALKKINEDDNIDNYWLESEGIEDFSIGEGGKYLSIHQVKNRKDDKLEDYREALFNIVKRIRDFPDIENGYLHTKNEIQIDDWDKQIIDQLMNYYPEKIQKLENIVECPERKDEVYQEILSKWNEGRSKLNRNTSDINKLIIKEIEEKNEINNKEDITIEVFEAACKNVLSDEKVNYNFVDKEKAIKKIKLYRYEDNLYADSSKIYEMTEKEIKLYWADKAAFRVGKEELYYFQLLQMINDNVTERAEQKSKEMHIPLKRFKDILDKNAKEINITSKEECLLRLKDLYMKEKDAFCDDEGCQVKSIDNCEKCKLSKISTYIALCPLKNLEVIFRIMALHKSEELTKDGFELFSEPELINSFFAGITEVDKDFFLKQCKVLCQVKDKFIMSTTIDVGRIPKRTFKGLLENDIQDVCNNIIKNDGYDTTLMEVDKLITRDYDTEDIFQEACKINLISEKDDKFEDKLKYMNITKTKKVGLISVENAKKEYGERR